MRNLITNWLVSKFNNENFMDKNEKENIRNDYSLVIGLFFIIISQILLLFFGKFLWNNYFVKTFKNVNSINTVWDLLALSILFKLIIY